MALVRFRSVLGGEIAVNAGTIFAVVPNGTDAGVDTLLWWDAPREAHLGEPLQTVQQKLGAAFVTFPAASLDLDTYVVNKAMVIAVVPHPQKPDVCFLQGVVRQVVVKGAFEEVVARLSA